MRRVENQGGREELTREGKEGKKKARGQYYAQRKEHKGKQGT